ncbi:alpha/beta hydrolase [Thalassotalea euphylliae]|uniref:Alpha/beta hydrolase n=1 Tax=Thalassotalea euphylliae TaxID=1655234 RepID=A0A3E0TVN0_9GAMM|nr:alpha/beta hydrolase [Thalassotalea euphylliae]REL27972.1 alpha/beta hydrolase [Thalassotalea euphylliae]
MLFVTNRIPNEGYQTKIGRELTFDLQNTTPSKHLFFCKRSPDNKKYFEEGSASFFTQLKALSEKTQVLLYIHGFNNTDEADIFPNALALEEQINQYANQELVKVVPIIWPCDDDSALAFIDDYWDDQHAADASGKLFYRLFGKFVSWQKQLVQQGDECHKRINVLAHSMGNRVLMNTLYEWAKAQGDVPQLFRNAFLIAADIENEALEKGEKGQHIVDSARNVVIYYANDDLAMPASKVANLKNKTLSRRLGMTGAENLNKLPKKVYQVDCDNFNNTIDKPKGHTYFLHRGSKQTPVIKHMAEAIKTARVHPSEREYELPYP